MISYITIEPDKENRDKLTGSFSYPTQKFVWSQFKYEVMNYPPKRGQILPLL